MDAPSLTLTPAQEAEARLAPRYCNIEAFVLGEGRCGRLLQLVVSTPWPHLLCPFHRYIAWESTRAGPVPHHFENEYGTPDNPNDE